MANAVSTTIINGYYKYLSAVVKPKHCSWNAHIASDCTEGYSNLDALNDPIPLSDINRVAAAHKNSHYTDYILSRDYTPWDRQPQVLKYIYERDEKQLTQDEIDYGIWHPRIKMLNIAYQCSNIFALSIVPKNPLKEQSWYFKKLITYDPSLVGEGESRYYTETINGSQIHIPRQRVPLGGFIKPFHAFYSDAIQPTLSLDKLPSTVHIENINGSEKIAAVVELHFSGQTQNSAKEILNCFLEDSEASYIGLLVLNPNEQFIFSKEP